MKPTTFKSRAQEALAFMAANPEATPYSVANQFNVSRAYLYARKHQSPHSAYFVCRVCGKRAKAPGRKVNPNSKTQLALSWLDNNQDKTASEAARLFSLKGPGSVVHALAMRNRKTEDVCTKCKNISKVS